MKLKKRRKKTTKDIPVQVTKMKRNRKTRKHKLIYFLYLF
jgi:hypothetical protein